MVKSFGPDLHFQNLLPLTSNTFSLTNITEKEVEEYIDKIDQNKSVGCDGISAKLLKNALFLEPLIPHLINKSFIDSKVPEIWKTAIVKALHKSGPKDVFSNYRPISILPTITKIFEKFIF